MRKARQDRSNTSPRGRHPGGFKKKINAELRLYFPSEFADGSINFYSEVNRKAILQLKLITAGNDPKIRAAIKAINDWQLSLAPPKNFDNQSPDYYIKKIEKAFETLCATLEDLGVSNPKRLTVFEFYSRLEYYKEKKPKGKNKTTSKK